MGRRNARYNLEQLVSILEKQKPGLLARLAPNKAFEFQERKRFREDYDVETSEETKSKAEFELHVGHDSGARVWLCYDSVSKPWLWYHSERGRCYDSTDFKRVTLIMPFVHFKPSRGSLYPWADPMKAFASFLFLRAGHVDEWVDFGYGEGLEMLIAALEFLPAPEALHETPSDETAAKTSTRGGRADTDLATEEADTGSDAGEAAADSDTDHANTVSDLDRADGDTDLDLDDADKDTDTGEDPQDNQSNVPSASQEKTETKAPSTASSLKNPAGKKKRSHVEYLDGETDHAPLSKTQRVYMWPT